jgi:hypothetical protein
MSAQRIFQSVVKGVLGAATYKGGAETAALGLNEQAPDAPQTREPYKKGVSS